MNTIPLKFVVINWILILVTQVELFVALRQLNKSQVEYNAVLLELRNPISDHARDLSENQTGH